MNTTFFKTILWLVVISIFIIILQHTIFSLKFFENIKPELFTLLVLHYAFSENNRNRGYFLASFVGFTEDVLTNQIFGLNIFIKSSFFLIIYFLKDKIFFKSLFLKSLSGIIINLLEIFIILGISKIFSFTFANPLKDNFLNYVILYSFVTPLFLYLLDKIQPFFIKDNET